MGKLFGGFTDDKFKVMLDASARYLETSVQRMQHLLRVKADSNRGSSC